MCSTYLCYTQLHKMVQLCFNEWFDKILVMEHNIYEIFWCIFTPFTTGKKDLVSKLWMSERSRMSRAMKVWKSRNFECRFFWKIKFVLQYFLKCTATKNKRSKRSAYKKLLLLLPTPKIKFRGKVHLVSLEQSHHFDAEFSTYVSAFVFIMLLQSLMKVTIPFLDYNPKNPINNFATRGQKIPFRGFRV